MNARTIHSILIFALIFSCTSATGQVTIPDIQVRIWTESAADVSLVVLPDGTGTRFDQAQTLGGGTTDATLYLELLDSETPVVNFPAEDLWLEARLGGLVVCTGGTVADRDTDANGITLWAAALQAGGTADPSIGDGLAVFLMGDPYSGPDLDRFTLVSPDLNGDRWVNVADIPYFASDFSSGLAPRRSDFLWDGVMNLSDVGRFAAAMGSICP